MMKEIIFIRNTAKVYRSIYSFALEEKTVILVTLDF
jgi:hypothetical protein